MKETIIQFGEGNFLRGFFDYFLHGLHTKGLYEGKAVVVQPIAQGRVEALNAQGGRYHLYLRGIADGEVKCEKTLVESISRGVDPYRDFDAYMSLADNPDFRFVVSNTTEAGIAFDPTCRMDDKPCQSFPGKLAQLLYRRYQNGLGGFVFLACELIDNNADELKRCLLQYAELWGLEKGFVEWLERENVFANTLVDRIVTGYPHGEEELLDPDDALVDTAELFHLWVIEGNFEDELPLQHAGYHVVWTDDAKPYKKTKVRILNGAHTSMVPAAILSGLETVGECMRDETVSAFLRHCVMREILPTIGDNEERLAFAASVFERFSNPFIQHRLRSIALNSVSKFAVRVLPTILEYKEKNGTYPKGLTMSFAYLMYFYKNNTPDDSPEVMALMKELSVAEILARTDFWGADLSDMLKDVTLYYDAIENMGAKDAMVWILSK